MSATELILADEAVRPAELFDFELAGAEIARQIRECKRADVARGLEHAKLGLMLMEVKRHLPHGEFEGWLKMTFKAEFGLSLRTAQRYMATARRVAEYFEIDFCESIEFEERLRDLLNSPKGKKFVPGFKSPRRLGLAKVKDDPNNWPSPKQFIEAAKKLLGGIDCDPCALSGEHAAALAELNYTASDDGLSDSNPWEGRVWISPGHHGDMRSWIDKGLNEFASGRMSEGLMLLPESALSLPRSLLQHPIAITTEPLTVAPSAGDVVTLPTRALLVYLSQDPSAERLREAISDIAVAFEPLR